MNLWRSRSAPWPALLAAASLAVALSAALQLRPAALAVGGEAPDLRGSRWFNHRPATLGDLRGSAVLLEFFALG